VVLSLNINAEMAFLKTLAEGLGIKWVHDFAVE
jgi:hypothetical protein